MVWAAPTKPEDMFKSAESVAKHKTGLKVLIYGKEDTMKTGFALSFPPPVYVFDTELGAPPLFQHFVYCPTCKKHTTHIIAPDGGPCEICKDTNGKLKDIRWCDATYPVPELKLTRWLAKLVSEKALRSRSRILNPQTGMHDASVALQALESGIAALKDVKAGTVVIDSGTDVILSAQSLFELGHQWDWIQEWLNEIGKHKEGQLLRFECTTSRSVPKVGKS